MTITETTKAKPNRSKPKMLTFLTGVMKLGISFACLLWVMNALIIFYSNPVPVQFNSSKINRSDQNGIEIRHVAELRSGGFYGMSRELKAYVNLMEEHDSIYLDADIPLGGIAEPGYLYQHEYAHIKQKHLIAKQSGGYPSIWNPIQSFIYYSNLLLLNHYYEQHLPAVPDDRAGGSIIRGVEAAADCYTQHTTGRAHYNTSYILPAVCTPEQKQLVVDTIENQQWFN